MRNLNKEGGIPPWPSPFEYSFKLKIKDPGRETASNTEQHPLKSSAGAVCIAGCFSVSVNFTL